MDLQAVQQFIEQNKDNPEVQGYVGGFVTPDRVQKYIDSEDGKKIIQPKLDSYFTKGLETWKEKSLPKVLEEEISKRFPAETPEQKQLRELHDKLNKLEQEKTRESLKNVAITQATQKGLPVNLVDFFIGQDQDSTVTNLAKLEETWQKALQDAVEAKFKDNGRTPPRNTSGTPTEIEQLEKDYQEALKTRNVPLQIALKNKIIAVKNQK
ncbi:hypothetical protein BHU72_11980 [Desulfuribacillus stibiiarsenatis]|uniref:Uncharacterized protein n=1 Tax=Desulfuribacillus stibiiarsenatis TaxID=1390249 RepID=A0A1E5L7Z1_9FIRM|nr:DUF4355 domain-containing protein [Desulfuribacillus stibiiarsenatis]OEH86246.1 hypothetical protein BHU72_11980 [Desulfuribacillus stibiiarsenatis]